jgi:gluconate 2-dehydrogenase gamma chain
MTDTKLARRQFLSRAGVAGTAAAAAPLAFVQPAPAASPAPVAQQIAQAKAPAAAPAVDTFQALNATEQAFIQAVVDTFIPADGLSPSGTDCGVAVFIDRQLAGAYGNGSRFYRSGPFLKGKPEHGYQLPLVPLEFFRQGIAETNAWVRKVHGKEFDRLSPADREAVLKEMDGGKAQLAGLNGKQFFEALLSITMEGFFSDPIYGGNRDMVAWKMIGYPGLPATYADKIDQYRGKKYDGAPQSIADFS